MRTRDLDNVEPSTFATDCINALLGLWSKPKHYSYSVETVTYTEYLQTSGAVMRRAVAGHPTLHDYILKASC